MSPVDLYALHRLARVATDLGYYNAAKLFSAAAASLVNRQLYSETLPKTEADFLAALQGLEPDLLQANLDASLTASLKNIRAALSGGRLVFYDDVPPIFVCRICGQIAREQPPEYCPACGAGQLTFQNFSAVYYLEPEPIRAVLAQLARTPDWLEHILGSLSAEQIAQKVGGVEGEWSLLEAAGHLVDAQDLIAQRVQLYFENESPDLAAKAAWDMIEAAQLSAPQAAARFRQSRAAMLTRLRAAEPIYWTRLGRHAEFGPVTLQQQVSYFAKHEQWHMAQMTRIRRALLKSRGDS
jgi:uncharacterized damage-inducible protein DinB